MAGRSDLAVHGIGKLTGDIQTESTALRPCMERLWRPTKSVLQLLPKRRWHRRTKITHANPHLTGRLSRCDFELNRTIRISIM